MRLQSALFLVVGLINLFPLIGVLGPERLQSLYGIAIPGAELELLMRHRAVLLGLVGALLIAAAFRSRVRPIALVAGFVSMLAFLVLALPLANHGAAITRVFWADVFALGLLSVAWIVSRFERRPTGT